MHLELAPIGDNRWWRDSGGCRKWKWMCGVLAAGGRDEASTVALPSGEQVPSSALDVLGDFGYP